MKLSAEITLSVLFRALGARSLSYLGPGPVTISTRKKLTKITGNSIPVTNTVIFV